MSDEEKIKDEELAKAVEVLLARGVTVEMYKNWLKLKGKDNLAGL